MLLSLVFSSKEEAPSSSHASRQPSWPVDDDRPHGQRSDHEADQPLYRANDDSSVTSSTPIYELFDDEFATRL